MNYKLEGAINKNKGKLIVCIILWLILTIVFVIPMTYAVTRAQALHQGLTEIIKYYSLSVNHPVQSMSQLAKHGLIIDLLKNIFLFTLIYCGFFLVGFLKSRPKSQYEDIEHGSSDWSEHGEQYRILDKKKGIVLAENNYLPVNKPGNVNVMVIGRIWFW